MQPEEQNTLHLEFLNQFKRGSYWKLLRIKKWIFTSKELSEKLHLPTNMSPTCVSVNLVGIIRLSMHVKNTALGWKTREKSSSIVYSTHVARDVTVVDKQSGSERANIPQSRSWNPGINRGGILSGQERLWWITKKLTWGLSLTCSNSFTICFLVVALYRIIPLKIFSISPHWFSPGMHSN